MARSRKKLLGESVEDGQFKEHDTVYFKKGLIFPGPAENEAMNYYFESFTEDIYYDPGGGVGLEIKREYLKVGDCGTVSSCHGDGQTYTIDFRKELYLRGKFIGSEHDVQKQHLAKTQSAALETSRPTGITKPKQASNATVLASDKTSGALQIGMSFFIGCFIGIFYQLF